MKKLLFLLILFLIPAVFAIEDCMTIKPLTKNDIPCMLITSFPYERNCENYTLSIYNSSPALIGEVLLTDYTDTGLCNTTFNFTQKGSYTINITSGETGRVIVEQEEDNMASFSIMFFMIVLTIALYWAAITKDFHEHFLANYIIKKALFTAGILMTIVDLTIALTISNTFGLNLENELFLMFWISHKVLLFFLYGFVIASIIQALNLWKLDKKRKRMGEDAET